MLYVVKYFWCMYVYMYIINLCMVYVAICMHVCICMYMYVYILYHSGKEGRPWPIARVYNQLYLARNSKSLTIDSLHVTLKVKGRLSSFLIVFSANSIAGKNPVRSLYTPIRRESFSFVSVSDKNIIKLMLKTVIFISEFSAGS